MAARADARSRALQARAVELTPGGVHSNVRLTGPSVFFERGKGAWLWDADGNDYVDYLLGQGPNFLGHAHDDVITAVDAAMRRGGVFGSQHVLENEAGELFLDSIGWADRVRFCVSGTEADQAALRLARAVTGRTKIIRFEGHYHGWLDNVLIKTVDGVTGPASAGQSAHQLDDSIILGFNDAEALAAVLAERGAEVAAVILEPMMCNSGAILPVDGYLQRVRELCTEHGAMLIFDEVITGFRLALGGAAERFGVTPDLAVYGKAMAGGWPVAALAGRAEPMARFAADVNHSGTFNSSVPACAAVSAAITVLRQEPPYQRIEEHGTRLMDGLRKLGADHDLPLRVQGLPAAFHVGFGAGDGPVRDYAGLTALDLHRYADLVPILVDHGIWVAPRGIWYVSAAHGDSELTAVLERLDAALTAAERG
ncbi:aspartate aminotransferase family protein [Microlunatus speluncae]|uniref:aspartate aminotransferase family protein n=1 Tax=Microlunatus speluncae TaxID=2594267 RepID=UPI0012665D40|nr:aspartate aminotransferase family protein [Microlunatus speluncae]